MSVQVGKDCHYAGSVNYVVYGRMMRLCHDDFVKDDSPIADWFSQEEMLELVYIHKNFTGYAGRELPGRPTNGRSSATATGPLSADSAR